MAVPAMPVLVPEPVAAAYETAAVSVFMISVMSHDISRLSFDISIKDISKLNRVKSNQAARIACAIVK
jgi:hypothetical protein